MIFLYIFLFWYLILGVLPCIFYIRSDLKHGTDFTVKILLACFWVGIFGPIVHIALWLDEHNLPEELEKIGNKILIKGRKK